MSMKKKLMVPLEVRVTLARMGVKMTERGVVSVADGYPRGQLCGTAEGWVWVPAGLGSEWLEGLGTYYKGVEYKNGCVYIRPVGEK